MSTYEAMLIFQGSIKEEDLDGVVKKATAEVTKLGGEVENTTRMGKKAFARILKKQTSGHYVLVTFRLDGDKMSDLNARFQLNESVFRVQITHAKIAAEAVAETAEGKADGVTK